MICKKYFLKFHQHLFLQRCYFKLYFFLAQLRFMNKYLILFNLHSLILRFPCLLLVLTNLVRFLVILLVETNLVRFPVILLVETNLVRFPVILLVETNLVRFPFSLSDFLCSYRFIFQVECASAGDVDRACKAAYRAFKVKKTSITVCNSI